MKGLAIILLALCAACTRVVIQPIEYRELHLVGTDGILATRQGDTVFVSVSRPFYADYLKPSFTVSVGTLFITRDTGGALIDTSTAAMPSYWRRIDKQ